MADIISFPGHKWYHCDPSCSGCMICDGGLGACVTCGGFEGSLAKDCPQVRCEMIVHDEVHAGRIDYDRRRGWYRKERIDVREG